MKKIIIVCGGPSEERGISLNSARSVYDNLDKSKYEVNIIYYNCSLDAYYIDHSLIYSNTPLDFDYKLKRDGVILEKKDLDDIYRSCDAVFPAIHGEFGEDGKLQGYLDELGVTYIGSGKDACYNTSDKYKCQKILKEHGFFTTVNWLINKGENLPSLDHGHYVIKPLQGGSSMGVQYFKFPIKNANRFKHQLEDVFSYGNKAIIEPFFEGIEFTLIVLETPSGEPMALVPTEIEFTSGSDKFFNYRKKYLATIDTRYHTPPRFSEKLIGKIRAKAEQLFSIFNLQDFARVDGWLSNDNEIWFSDVNAISGMEQNSFLFQQSSIFGFSHKQLIDYLITKKINTETSFIRNKEDIPILFGGDTAERQISIMSGTNVWMKLKSSEKYNPIPFFMDSDKNIYQIPAFLCLHHTVEEIEEKISSLFDKDSIKYLNKIKVDILYKMNIEERFLSEPLFKPRLTSLNNLSKKYDFLFLGLHGGSGEDGTIQKDLDEIGLQYNGAGAECSALCMDKYKTGKRVLESRVDGVTTANKFVIKLDGYDSLVKNMIEDHNVKWPLILKPVSDGCSAGVIRVDTISALIKALSFFYGQLSFIPKDEIQKGQPRIELPSERIKEILVEEYINTDQVKLDGLDIVWDYVNDLVEITVGVIGRKGEITSFNPSQTVALDGILTLEEKFMGGHGINITPPPEKYVTRDVIRVVKERIAQLSNVLGVEGYARIDAFMNIKTGDLIIIEINTLPALTPSTVIYHQALAENPAINPCGLLERIIESGRITI